MQYAKADSGNPHGRNDILLSPFFPLFVSGEAADQPIDEYAHCSHSQQDRPDMAIVHVIGADKWE